MDINCPVHVEIVGAKGKPRDQVKKTTRLFLVVYVSNEDLSATRIDKIKYCMTRRTLENGKEILSIQETSPADINLTQMNSSPPLLFQLNNPLPVGEIFLDEKKPGFTPVVLVNINVQGRSWKVLAKYPTNSSCVNTCFHERDNTFIGCSTTFLEGNKKRKLNEETNVNQSNLPFDVEALLNSTDFLHFQEEETAEESKLPNSNHVFKIVCHSSALEQRKDLSAFVGIADPLLPNFKFKGLSSPDTIRMHTVKAGENLQIRFVHHWCIIYT